jgi:hypothetical protein
VAMLFIETHDQKSPLRDLLANLLNIQWVGDGEQKNTG